LAGTDAFPPPVRRATRHEEKEIGNRFSISILSQASVNQPRETTPMPTTTVYQRNFRKLLLLIPNLADLQVGHYLRFEAGKAFMPLSVDTLDREGKRLHIALAHNFEQNGDLVPDPDMELRVDLEAETVEALTFQDQLVYQEVYPASGKVLPNLKSSLNSFLSTWLSNLRTQGFRLVREKTENE
jgi:uncharacterized protein YqiB (DUF1249 family)